MRSATPSHWPGMALRLLVCCAAGVIASAEPWALKSRFGGGYAGRAAYDPVHGELVMTGTLWDTKFLDNWALSGENSRKAAAGATTAGGPRCFVAKVRLTEDGAAPGNYESWSPPDSCGALALLRAPPDGADNIGALIAGYELVADGADPGRTARVSQAIALVDLQTYETREQALQSRPFAYPTAVAAERGADPDALSGGESQSVFLAITQGEQVPPLFHLDSMADMGAPLASLLQEFYLQQVTEMGQVRAGRGSADLEVATIGGVEKVGAASGVIEWHTPFTGEPGHDSGDVIVTSVAHAPATRYGECVLVVGAARGSSGPMLGTDYGRPVRGGADDWDGFLTRLDAKTGKRSEKNGAQEASRRFKSPGSKDDWIVDLCFQDPDIAYVVGTTTGKVAAGNHLDEDGGAFIIKIDVDTMAIKWQVQLEGMGVLGTACAITEEAPVTGDNLLYVAGVFPASHPGLDMGGNKHQGGDGRQAARASEDAFVVALDADSNNGQIRWIREITFEDGGRRHESISSLSLNPENGHVIAFGNSREVDGMNDVFAVALDVQTGNAGDLAGILMEREDPPVPQQATATNKPPATPPSRPPATRPIQPSVQPPPPVQPPTKSLKNGDATADAGGPSGGALAAAIAVPSLVLWVASVAIWFRFLAKKEGTTSPVGNVASEEDLAVGTDEGGPAVVPVDEAAGSEAALIDKQIV